MSTKHPELRKLEHVNVDDLMSQGTVDKDGYLHKEGGHFKSWKRRWCILRGATLYYFSAPHSCFCKGAVILDPHAEAVPGTPFHKSDSKHAYFTVKTRQRMLHMYANSHPEMESWVTTVNVIATSLLQQVHDRSLSLSSAASLPTPLSLSSPLLLSPSSSSTTTSSTTSTSNTSTSRSYSMCVHAPSQGNTMNTEAHNQRSNSFGEDVPVAVVPSLVSMPLPLHVPQLYTKSKQKKTKSTTSSNDNDLDL
ncbi:hypothetical protein Pelo_7756 [Pelomyxa schiedti]|nr:hypothetical protein Pelo_7756 [Pelomyxa schiedti]